MRRFRYRFRFGFGFSSRRSVFALVALVSLIAPTAAGAASLDARIDALVAASPVRRQTSVFVWDQTTLDVLYTRSANRPVAPASTMKLLTGSAALTQFGPEHRFTTQLALRGHQEGKTWIGDVWLVGGGDPSLSTSAFARDNYRGQGTNVATLLSPLRQRGITTVSGSLGVDDTLLDRVRWVPEWRRDFRFEEAGALGALTINQSMYGRFVGGPSAHDPDLRAGEVFKALLERDGVQVQGGITRGAMPVTAEVVGEATSPPLRVLLQHMDQESDNFYAEVLLKDIGADHFGPAGTGSTIDGRRAAYFELTQLGVDLREVRWLDGSGLAYGDRVTARIMGHLLGIGAQEPWAEEWIGSFARSGISGTLRKRMTSLPFRGRVSAKTGTLRNVSALAGFSRRVGSDRRYGFVVMTWDAAGRAVQQQHTRPLQDRIAMVLVR